MTYCLGQIKREFSSGISVSLFMQKANASFQNGYAAVKQSNLYYLSQILEMPLT